MAIMYGVRMTVEFVAIAEGTGAALLGQFQSNNPGISDTAGATDPGPVPFAQSLQLIQGAIVPVESPVQSDFNTAMTTAVAGITTQMGTAGAFSGGPSTPLALIQGWSSGSP